MATGKDFPLSITVRTVDKATSGLKRINDQIERARKPYKALGEQFRNLYKSSGLSQIASGFKGIGSELRGVARDLGIVGAAAGAAVFGFKHLVEEFDNLGDTAEKAGVSVDFLAQLRHSAEAAGSSAEELDAGLSTFTKSVGQARAGTGKLTGFLKKVSPELLKQVKGAKSNEEAFDLMANAIAKIPDPARRAALATAAFGGAGTALAPLLGRGKKGIDELRQAYFEHAGSQQAAADAAQKAKEAMEPLHGEFTRMKATLVTELAPAFIELTRRLQTFLTSHRTEIAAFIRNFGEALPGAISRAIDFLGEVRDALAPVVQWIGKMVEMVGGAGNAVKILVVAWASFKALNLAGHLLGIVGGLVKMAGAIKAVSTAGAVADAAGGGGAGGGKLGVLKWVPHVAAVTGGAAVGTWLGQKAGTQRLFGSDDARLQRDALGSDRDSFGRHKVAHRLGLTEGELAKRLAEGRAMLAARAGSDEVSARAAANRVPSAAEFRKTQGVGPLAAEAPAAATAKVEVEFKNAPPGMRVRKDGKSTADVDLSTGYQMVTP